MNCLPFSCPCRTLLGHLTRNELPLTEIAATHSLAYLLNRAPGARAALADHLTAGGMNLLAPIATLHVEAPAQGKKGFPDLKAVSAAGQELFLLEVKFNAGLTDRQKNGYRTSLKPEGPNATIFLAPQARLEDLAEKLAKNPAWQRQPPSWKFQTSDPGLFLSLISWEELIPKLAQATSPALDQQQQYDLNQLQDLAEIRTLCNISPPPLIKQNYAIAKKNANPAVQKQTEEQQLNLLPDLENPSQP